jgi:outer membrane lipoprotein-sorting protein
MNPTDKAAALRAMAAEAVPETTDLWPAIRQRITASPRHKRPVVAAVAIAAALAVAIAGTFPLWNPANTVSAQAILDRAQTTAMAPLGARTYHLRLVRQTKGMAIDTEVWFAGADRQRITTQVRDSNGAIDSSSDEVFNGQQAWLMDNSGGQTQVVHTVGANWNKPADGWSQDVSLSAVLAQYSRNKACSTPNTVEQQGKATVANRSAYVIDVIPANCGGSPSAGAVAQGRGEGNVGRMMVWVDTQSFLPLKSEVLDTSGNVMDRSEVTSIDYDVAIPDATFAYVAPAGATVRNFTGGNADDIKRAVSGSAPSNPKDGKQPGQ